MRKQRILQALLVVVAMLSIGWFDVSTTNTFNASQFNGNQGQKITLAQAQCLADTTIPCVIILDPILAAFQQGNIPARCGNCLWIDYRTPGQVIFNSAAFSFSLKVLNTIRFADQFTGADGGAKINAADADLSGIAGEIWVNQAAGTAWTTPVTLSANHTLRFIQGGTYTSSGSISLGVNTALLGPPSAMGIGGSNTQVILKEANTANLASFVIITGSTSVIENVTIDGNKANNASAGVGLLISSANRISLRYLTVQNAKTHGISVASTGTSNQSCCGEMFHVISIANGGDGVFSQGTADWEVTQSQFENNQYGVEMSDSPTWRWANNDFGGNTLDGFFAYGTAAGLKSNGHIIETNQFGNQFNNDIRIVGFDTVGGASTSIGNIISGNSFFGTSNRTPANTFDNIKLVDGGQNVITGNFLASAGVTKAAIEVTETAAGRITLAGTTAANTLSGAWGTAPYIDATTNGTFGQQIPMRGGCISSLDLFDTTAGAATPHKLLRISGGVLQILNSACAAAIFQLTDAGLAALTSMTVGGGGTISGILPGSATLTFTSIAAVTGQEQTVTITGASTTNFGVSCSPRASLGNVNLAWQAWVSATNTVSVRVVNPTAGAVTPAAVVWGCTVTQ